MKTNSYREVWNTLRFMCQYGGDKKAYYSPKEVRKDMREFGYRKYSAHVERYLLQFHANGTASKKKGAYRIKAAYLNRVEPKPRVKVASEKKALLPR